MVKRLICLLCIFLAFFSLYAKGGDDHDRDLCGLFYDIAYAEIIKKSSNQMMALCSASFLSLDYNSNKNYEKKGIDSFTNLGNIGLTFNFERETLHLEGDGGSDHEKVSHKGWEPYSKYDATTYSKWLLRKEILIKTVNKVFSFSDFDESLSLKKLNIEQSYAKDKVEVKKLDFLDGVAMSMNSRSYSLAAVIYYTHILGDIDFNSEGTADTRLSLYELCTDMAKHLKIVFGNRLTRSKTGKILLEKLKVADSAEMIMKYLQSALQELLKEESFYTKSLLNSEIKKAVGEK